MQNPGEGAPTDPEQPLDAWINFRKANPELLEALDAFLAGRVGAASSPGGETPVGERVKYDLGVVNAFLVALEMHKTTQELPSLQEEPPRIIEEE